MSSPESKKIAAILQDRRLAEMIAGRLQMRGERGAECAKLGSIVFGGIVLGGSHGIPSIDLRRLSSKGRRFI